MDLENWKTDVQTHTETVKVALSDRRILQEYMSNYLKKFFDYDDIEFSQNFQKIKLLFNVNQYSTVTPKNIGELNLYWRIALGFTEELGTTIVIEVYPFREDD